jgi:glycosyltransferase involved in cell wall biosynthesis
MQDQAEAIGEIAFDVSDLLNYYLNARLPTGIQRVQINVIYSLLRSTTANVSVVCFVQESNFWVTVPKDLFLRITELSLLSGEVHDRAWQTCLLELRCELLGRHRAVFQEGTILVNLGTSWWLKNYFLMIREAKIKYGLRYVPFVHDLIPVLTPEHCTRELTQDFIAWLLGVFSHADAYLVNSESTRRDLVKVAEILGSDPPQPVVVRLDGNANDGQQMQGADVSPLLDRLGLAKTPYILFVSTIESRKNHILAFNTWLDLLKKHGVKNIPALICVGNPGWLVDAALRRLESSSLLQERVKILSKVSDKELSSLYSNCLFTIYPSTYEGWGLPVTESLCHGKVPLIADSSSLPEAGGEYADYFSPDSQADFCGKLERLIMDAGYRQSREALIQSNFRARSWDAIASQIVDEVRKAVGSEPIGAEVKAAGVTSPAVVAGVYYPLAAVEATSIVHGMFNPEVFRSGTGWNFPDNWGVWMSAEQASLRFQLERAGKYILYLGLLGLPNRDAEFSVEINGRSKRVGSLGAGQRRWVIIHFSRAGTEDSEMVVALRSKAASDFAEVTNGVDRRRGTLGVVGFCICPIDDAISRLNFLEALQAGDFASVALNR